MTQSAPKPTIVVVGAGIIGLTSALKIQALLSEHSPSRPADILLVAKEWPTSIPGAPIQHSPDYASMWAGAHVRPIPASTPQLRREAGWLKRTVADLERHLQTEPFAGITRLPGVELLGAPPSEYVSQTAESFAEETGLRGFRRCADDELPEGVRLGFEYETYCINAPLYSGNLLRRFVLQGGKTKQHDLKSEWEPYSWGSHVKLVVNASGMGFGDAKCFPIRGQTVLTNLTAAVKTITTQNEDGTWSFVIPRGFNGGTVVGGTKEPNDWRIEPSLETRERLLQSAKRIIADASNQPAGSQAPEIQVIKDVVGRRPAREGGMRVETEVRETGRDRKHVVHAYGAGGRGYEMSWGVAGEVQGLVEELLPQVLTTKSRL